MRMHTVRNFTIFQVDNWSNAIIDRDIVKLCYVINQYEYA